MSKPIAVLISDVHYSVHTLILADAAMRQAISRANELNAPIIVAGDLHDTKANLRGECVNAMINTFQLCDYQPIILVGNHDRLNEKAPEHALNFLNSYAKIVDSSSNYKGMYLLAYSHSLSELRTRLSNIQEGSTVILHQGLNGSNMGDYIKDDTALNREDVAGLRVISGHYHSRQTIALPDGGKWDFIGNPYTLTYGEANDPEKGYQILYDDGTMEFVPTNLRRHRIIDMSADEVVRYSVQPNDLVWIKVRGTKEQLSSVKKSDVCDGDCRLELICTEMLHPEKSETTLKSDKLLDSIIDSLSEVGDDRKSSLKTTWRKLCD